MGVKNPNPQNPNPQTYTAGENYYFPLAGYKVISLVLGCGSCENSTVLGTTVVQTGVYYNYFSPSTGTNTLY